MEWYLGKDSLNKDTLRTNSSQPRINGVPLPLFPKPCVMAADPVGIFLSSTMSKELLDSIQFTSDAYKDRTSFPCSDLSFAAIAEGSLPPFSINIVDNTISNIEETGGTKPQCLIEMVICSFALHLIETPSKLFALLWQLSTRARWLVILAPHKKPEVSNLLLGNVFTQNF